MKRKTILIGAALLLSLVGGVCATRCVFGNSSILLIRRADVVECGLPDGSKFILRNQYLWDPLAELIPADVTTRYYPDGRDNYEVSFLGASKFGKKKREELFSSQSHATCTPFGMKNGIVLAPGQYLLPKGQKWESPTLQLGGPSWELLEFKPSPESYPEPLRSLLAPLHVVFPLTGSAYASAFIMPQAGRLIFEYPLWGIPARPDGTYNIMAVYQSISTDNGKTWSDPVVTTQAEIFELGKSMEEQSFVAKPIRINGKSVERLEREAKRQAEREERQRLADVQAQKHEQERYANSLEYAIVNTDWPRFEQLLAQGKDVNAPYESRFRTDAKAPLLVALDKPEYAPYALELIKRGASLNPKGLPQGVTVLMLAAGYSTPEVIKALQARQRLDLNQPNPNGATALSYAVASGRTDNVRLLLKLGADAQVSTSEGSLIEIARLQGHVEIMQLLEKRH